MRSLLLISDVTDFGPASPAEAGLRSAADILVLDLAAPGGDAGQATFAEAYDFIRAAKPLPRRPRLYVRVPGLNKTMAIGVLDAAIGAGAEGIVLPQALGGHDVTRLDARISVEEAVHAIDHGSVTIVAEAACTARAALGLATFRGASHRLAGLIWSADRLAGDLGGISPLTPEGALRAPLAWTHGHFLIAAAAAGVTAILDATVAWPGIAPLVRYATARDDGFRAGMTRDLHAVPEIARIMAGSSN